MASKEVHPVLAHKKSLGQKAADILTKIAGSWIFITSFFILLIIWMFSGGYFFLYVFNKELNDPYPYIFLNLVLAVINAILAPIILMSQNRQSQRDRIMAEYDYKINKKSEKEIEKIKKQLDKIERRLK